MVECLLAQAPKLLPQAALDDVRVLIVDDSQVNRSILSTQLKSFGMWEEAVADAKQALAQLRAAAAEGAPFKLAVLDYQMPNMDGVQLAQAIQADHELTGLSLVLLTSVGQKGDANHFHNAGFAAYLSKPVHSETLRQTLASVLGMSREGGEAPLITRYQLAESGSEVAKNPHFSGRILLAEDVLANQKVASSMLKQLGVEVDIAVNGKEAVDRWAESPYDLIFMDCQMPEMDGYEATRIIREQERAQDRHIPIIALTANAMAAERQKCLDAGMDDHIAKPFKRDDLVSALSRWFDEAQPTSVPENTGEVESVERTPASSVTTTGMPTIDPAQLDAMREAMGEDFVELIPAAIESVTTLLEAFPAVIETSNIKEIQRLAHSIKSASANVGAMRLSAMAEKLEEQARQSEVSNVGQQVSDLWTEFDHVCSVLQQQNNAPLFWHQSNQHTPH